MQIDEMDCGAAMSRNDLPTFWSQSEPGTDSAALSHGDRWHEPESDFSRRDRTWAWRRAPLKISHAQSPAHAVASDRALGGQPLDRALRR